eukprot:CAMPEP_0183361950 /NCGR_PEP_ID=MMETSP0164_2-20130417/65279_1 /TAXON_ID=221442 /ORGANISM="Coccolithus pelagicus ssp braarudi, Strain PLY182g" /LENGTH=130 /DNA_ID=CAMNT_0025536679 /DNA_START=368 /DNA_END=756 /DNA_ORIENTATION=+
MGSERAQHVVWRRHDERGLGDVLGVPGNVRVPRIRLRSGVQDLASGLPVEEAEHKEGAERSAEPAASTAKEGSGGREEGRCVQREECCHGEQVAQPVGVLGDGPYAATTELAAILGLPLEGKLLQVGEGL